MNTMSEKRGYKYTEEFGFIPDDWGYLPLQELVQSMRLGGNYSNTLIENDLPLIKMGNIDRGKIILDKIEYVADKNIIIADKLIYGDFLFNTRNTPDLVGKVAVWKNELKNAYYNSNLLNIKFKKKLISSNFFINYIFNTPQMMLQLKNIATGTTSVAAIYSRDLLQLCIPVPSLPEQIKIAEVLGDIDSLIDNTQQLIDKKKNLKIATMQKLLTPKEGWQEKCFEQLFSKIPSKNYQIKTTEYRQYGKFPVVDQGQIKICGYSDNINKVYKNQNGVIVFGDHTRIFKYIDFDFVIGADGTQILNVNNENDVKYIYYMLCQKEIPNIGYNRHFKFLLDFKYCLPSKSEQQKIASILSDMDFEIESLEKEMEKYIDLKIGMMQQLLTGKVRLV